MRQPILKSRPGFRPVCVSLHGGKCFDLLMMLVLTAVWLGCDDVRAQDSTDQDSAAGAIRLPTSSLVQQSVDQLREQIRSNQPDQAADTFRRLATADPMLLLQSRDPGLNVPLYRILNEEFERLPESVRTAIRDAGNRPSRSTIAQAIREGRWKALISVMHQFPGSDGAQLARLLLAQAHRDRGHEAAAQHWLQPLSGSPSLSAAFREVSEELNQLIELRRGKDTINETPSSPAESTLTQEWHVRWKHRENVAGRIHQLIEQSLFISDGSAVPSWNASINNGHIFRRTLRGLAAFDLQKGTPVWTYRLTPNHLQYLNDISGFDSADPDDITELDGSFMSMVLLDGALNTVHVGRQAVYSVVAQQVTDRLSMQMGEGSQRKRSQLVALDRYDGRRHWTSGGAPLEHQFPTSLADTWFAGPPMTCGNLLYGIVEQEAEIRLVVVRQPTGELLDSTVLAFPDSTIGRDTTRSLIAATPVTVGGLILCPTTTGWLIAVDQLTHTVLWATRTIVQNDGAEDFERDNIDFMMAQYSRGRSPRTSIHVFDDSAVVAPWDSPELTFLDITSGVRLQGAELQDYSRIVAVSPDSLIISAVDESTLRRLDVGTQEIVWECHMPEDNGIPQGTGAVQDGLLAVGTSTGALLTLDIESGTIVSATPDMLPATIPGALFDAGSQSDTDTNSGVRNLVFITPDETICLTTETDLPDSPETSDRVARLVGNQQYEQAWEILTPVPDAAFEEDRALAELRFDTAFGLAMAGSLKGDINLRSLAVTDRQQHLSVVLEISESFAEQPRSAVESAIGLATAPQSWQAVIPSSLLVNSDASVDQPEQALLSTGTWVAHLVEQALIQDESLADTDAITEQLAALPAEVLLQIHHHASANVIRSRLMTVDDPEQALHLLVHLSRVSSRSDASSEDTALPQVTELPSWKKLFAHIDQLENPSARQLAIQRILLAAGTEEQVGLLPLAPDDIRAADEARFAWDESWVNDDYTTVPFARPQPSRQSSVELQAADHRDPVVSALTFRLHRDPERLSVYSAAPDSSQIWSITGSLPVDTATVSSTQVSRFGSIALLQSAYHLVAVSLLDQRILWQHQSLSDHRTALLTPASDVQLELPTEYPGLIAPRGNAFDWICLRDEESIRVVDALTGLDRWKFPLPADVFVSHTVADDDYILVAIDDSVIALDPRFGTRLSHQISPDEFDEALCSDNGLVVYLEASEEESKLRLVWKHPLNGEIGRSQEINHASGIQLLEADRLAVIHENRDVTTVDLKTGGLRQHAWSEVKTSESSSFEWDAKRMTYLEDAEYMYLVYQPTVRQMRKSMRGRIPNRQVTAFTAIRVLDRQSGEHLWEHVLPEDESALAMTDQLSLPFLVTIHSPFDKETRRPLGWVRFRAFNKRTGKQLVDSRLPMRFSFDEFQINAEPSHTIDLKIYGSHVRFERPGSPTIRRPGQ